MLKMVDKKYLRSMQFLPGARACIISGGGAWGAYSVGQLYELRQLYGLVCGISTGALQAPFVALGEYDLLRQAYNSVNNSIFSICPFTRKGNVRYLFALSRLLRGKHSVGELGGLRQLISTYYRPEHHQRLIDDNIIVLIGAVNMTQEPHRLELFSPQTHTYEQFCQAMYASCCFFPVAEMAPIQQPDGTEHYYADGGFLESIVIKEATLANIYHFDVFVLKHQEEYLLQPRPKTIFQGLKRLFKAWRYDTVYENLEDAIQEANDTDTVTLRVFRPPVKLSSNAMHFDKQQMANFFTMGRRHAGDYEMY